MNELASLFRSYISRPNLVMDGSPYMYPYVRNWFTRLWRYTLLLAALLEGKSSEAETAQSN
jgi:hypothetical protein